MMDSINSLGQDVARWIGQWEAGARTKTETIGAILDRFVFAIMEHSNELAAISAVMRRVPSKIASATLAALESNRNQDGSWKWPLGGPSLVIYFGGGPTSNPPPRELADQHEVEAICTLKELLTGVFQFPDAPHAR